MGIELYSLMGSPSCINVLMVARHLNIKLNVKDLDWEKNEQKSESFVKMNPQHCVPTIVDDGFVLWESRAITAYLVNQYSPKSSLYPSDPKKRAVIDRLMQFDIGSLYNKLNDYIMPMFMGNFEQNEQLNGKVKESLTLLDTLIGSNHYVAGDGLSLADLSILSTLSLLNFIDYDYNQWKNINQWMLRLKKELPYYDEIYAKNVNFGRDYLKMLRQKKE